MKELQTAQLCADLYGMTYGVYERENGSLIAFPLGDTDLLGPGKWVAICESRSPLIGAARLKEEVDRFLLTWG